MHADPEPAAVERLVQKQLDAYNARDIASFMQHWADDCKYYAFPSTLLADGAAEIRERHVERFKDGGLHANLKARLIVGNVVIDSETVRRDFAEGAGEVEVICIYQVEEGKIANAWFKMEQPRLLRPAAQDAI